MVWTRGTSLFVWAILLWVGPGLPQARAALPARPGASWDAAGRPVGGTEAVPGAPSVLDKLLDARRIIDPFEHGAQTVKVIVSLAEPPRLRIAASLETEAALQERQNEVAAIQVPVLATLAPEHFQVRYIFENQAAFSGQVTPEGLAQLLNDPRVESIEPVYPLTSHLRQGIDLIKAGVYRSTYSGQGVSIAICDTGIDYYHPRLGGAAFPNAKVIGGHDFGDGDPDPFPLFRDYARDYHGTGCAGIAAGALGDSGDYIGGVAPSAKLYALKLRDWEGGADTQDLLAAWNWCITNKNHDPANPILVISTSQGTDESFTGTCDSARSAYATAARNAVAAGITIVVSSGNDGYCGALQYPACLTDVISVGAVYDAAFASSHNPCVHASSCVAKYTSSSCLTGYYATDYPQADRVPSYSNTSSLLSLLAPANAAHTADMVGPAGASTGDYNPNFGGTSAACAYAAGAVACLQSAAKAVKGRYLSPTEVRDILTSTGDNITDTKPTPDITKPRINLSRAIDSLFGVKTLTLNGPAGQGDIAPAGDADWWYFTVGSSASYTIETSLGTLTDTYMHLYGPNSQTTEIDTNDDIGSDNRASRITRTLSAGTYYVKVRGYDDNRTGTYTIRLTTATPTPLTPTPITPTPPPPPPSPTWSIVGAWTLNYHWWGTSQYSSANVFFNAGGTFTTNEKDSFGTWTQSGNSVSFTFSNDTHYTGKLSSADSMSGNMEGFGGGGGDWTARRGIN